VPVEITIKLLQDVCMCVCVLVEKGVLLE